MEKRFLELRESLLRAGVAARHVRRYLAELADHLADLRANEERAGRSPTDAESAALARLGEIDGLARAMIEQRRFQSWCVRTPWAAFGFAPLVLLAGVYVLACSILWSGWRIFLPGAVTPFVPVDGFAVFYFGCGRLLYYSAPVLAGWGTALIAIRQRSRAVWPIAGLILTALIGATSHVQASPPHIPGGAGHVWMSLMPGPSVQHLFDDLPRAVAILVITALPYFVWRLRTDCAFSAPDF